MEDLKSEAEAKHIEIQLAAPDPAPMVACSPGVLISMTTNLVSNAIKFMGEALRRQITIVVRPVGGHQVEIAVSDTGPGIAPELGDKVFQPHVRGQSSVPGFGLGLATVRKLAEAHQGTVGVDRNPEGGSRFWFRLPAWAEAGDSR
jgi:signal transduction histidine kinase